MSTQREKLMESMSKSRDGHAIKLNESEFTAPKQATGLPLSPIRRLSPGEVRLSEKNRTAFDSLSQPEFERLKSDIAERGILVPLILKADKTLIAGHNRLRAAQDLGLEAVPVQYVETSLSPAQEKAFVIKDNLLRRQLKAEQQARMLAEFYPDYLDTVSSSEGGSLGGRKKQIEKETGLSGKTLQRHKKTHLLAKTAAKSEGKAKPELEHYRKAVQTLNDERRAKQPRSGNTISNYRSFAAVCTAIDKIRRFMPNLTTAELKDTRTQLARLLKEIKP